MARSLNEPLNGPLNEPPSASLKGSINCSIEPSLNLSVAPAALGGVAVRLSAAQQRMAFWQQLAVDAPLYNLSVVLSLRGPLDVAALQNGLFDLLERHHILRSRWVVEEGKVCQQVEPAEGWRLQHVQLDAADERERVAQADHWAQREDRRPFDLAHEPAMRALLLTWSANDHLLVWTFHHSACDGWSIGLLLDGLSQTYRDRSLGWHGLHGPGGLNGSLRPLGQVTPNPPSLPQPPLQYLDHAASEPQWLAGLRPRELAYWTRQLDGVPAELLLPTDHRRPITPRYRGADVTVALPHAASQALRDLGARTGTSVFMIVLALWQTLLHRYSGQRTVVTGAVVAGRDRPEFEGVVGLFANTVALRADFDAELTVAGLLAQAKGAVLDACEHQQLPFEEVVEALKLPREGGRPPLVQTMVVLQHAHAEGRSLGPVQLEEVALPGSVARFDLTLEMTERSDGLAGCINYDTDLFERATIERMAGHLQTLLAAMCADEHQPVVRLPLLSAVERAVLLGRGAARPMKLRQASLHQGFEAHARHAPMATALTAFSAGGQRIDMTYAELDRRAAELARALRNQGVVRNDIVALRTGRTAELVIGLLGILKAGAAYLPLDPVVPRDRVAFMLQDAGVRVVVGRAELLSDLHGLGVAAVCVDAVSEVPHAGSATPPDADVPPGDRAYVIYTSGSTGQPKGVGVSHHNVLRLFAACGNAYGSTADDVWTLFHSPAFDFSVWEFWGALLHGGRLVVVPLDVGRDPLAFRDLVLREQVTVLSQTPTAFRQLIDADLAGPPGGLALRQVILGGEALDAHHLEPWFDRHGDQVPRIVNQYGPTETTLFVTHRVMSRADLTRDAGSLIGRPLADVKILLLDAHLQAVPVGVPGEIHVAGPALTAGYLSRPELTAERFIADPFDAQPGARLYRTGDLARRLADGDLEYLGRIDGQVKLRGFRIEPAEVEAVIGRDAQVRQAVVTVREDVPGDQRLVAYVVPGDLAVARQGAWRDGLRERLRSALPDYMVPSHVVFVDRLPMNTSGKLDRSALPAPSSADVLGADRPMQAPRSGVERAVHALWRDVLQLEHFGVHDNFFDLGGHSLRLVRLRARLEASFAIKLSLSEVMQAPTVAQLARRVGGAALPAESLLTLRAGGSEPPMFFVHDGLGETLIYRSLANHLGPGIPVHALQPLAADGVALVHTRVVEMAAHYVERVRLQQPHGPYRLGGLCAGGVVAFEMAVQLQRAGERVSLLALIEAAETSAPARSGRHAATQLRRFVAELAAGLRPSNVVEPMLGFARRIGGLLAFQIGSRVDRLRVGFHVRRLQKGQQRKQPPSAAARRLSAAQIYAFAQHQHRNADPYRGDVLLLRATQGNGDPGDEPMSDLFHDPLFGWPRRVQGQVEAVDIAGGHYSMLQEPLVAATAAVLQARLDRVGPL